MFESIDIKDVKQEIGSLMKSLRKRNNWTQEQLSETLDMSVITIRNLESGKNFTINTLLKVLKAFDLLEDLNRQVVKYSEETKAIKSLY